jgi:hypothetical protein
MLLPFGAIGLTDCEVYRTVNLHLTERGRKMFRTNNLDPRPRTFFLPALLEFFTTLEVFIPT